MFGRVIFFWRTDLEVDWERTKNYYVGLLALYLSRIKNRANFLFAGTSEQPYIACKVDVNRLTPTER